ncbi:MAG: hypothetical protein LC768_04160 [Acidobacteria bacterium]|nr:hypothetical protein [Acidobacteriota bacterium]MCA1637519.1 hypothetical protein [Acidobacteriota bacterium]
MAKKKFDTNPLDPDFPRKAQEAQTSTLPKSNETDRIPPPSVTEEQTRRFDEANFAAYSSPYDGQQVPNVYQTAKLNSDVGNSSKRKVASVGLPENILTALPYLPWFVGLVAGVVILLFVPKSETKVRFHAAQGLAAHIGILIVTTILSGIGNITNLADIGNFIFQLATTIMLIIFAVKAWQGKPVHIESVDDLTEWLEEKIKPRS